MIKTSGNRKLYLKLCQEENRLLKNIEECKQLLEGVTILKNKYSENIESNDKRKDRQIVIDFVSKNNGVTAKQVAEELKRLYPDIINSAKAAGNYCTRLCEAGIFTVKKINSVNVFQKKISYLCK